MSKIRINDLARELEVKSKTILDLLPEIGITDKRSHSSALEDDEAEKVRVRLKEGEEAPAAVKEPAPAPVAPKPAPVVEKKEIFQKRVCLDAPV